MGKRVSNKTGNGQKGRAGRPLPARSTKTGLRARQKIKARKMRIAAAQRRTTMLEEVRRRFGEL